MLFIFLSTTTADDLSVLPSPLFQFGKDEEADSERMSEWLAYPNRWYLSGQYGGCSCHFRHLAAGSHMDFCPPEDWDPEEEDNVLSTGAIYDAFLLLVTEGHKVDIVDTWANDPMDGIKTIVVSLSEVGRDGFRFFEGYRFVFVP